MKACLGTENYGLLNALSWLHHAIVSGSYYSTVPSITRPKQNEGLKAFGLELIRYVLGMPSNRTTG